MASSLALVYWGAGFKYLLIASKRSLSVVIVGDKIIADELFLRGDGRRDIGIGLVQHEGLRDTARNLSIRHVSLGSRGGLLAVIPSASLSGAGCHSAKDEGEAIGSGIERPEA